MKRVVVRGELHGDDIRPPALLSEFKKLSIEESQVYFGDSSQLVDISCPACDCADKLPVFTKGGFQYNQCPECRSLFVSPRPSAEVLAKYYANSRAGKFRIEHFSRETAEARREHILRSRINWVGQIFDQAGPLDKRGYADIGTIFPLVFKEVQSIGLFDVYYSVNPPPLAEAGSIASGATVQTDALHDLGVVTAFEQLDHQFSPYELVKSAYDMLAPGGLFFLTTRTASGFDLQILWDKTPYIFVPEHLNLLSVDGLSHLISRVGFSLLELSTPGQLDVELVLQAEKADPTIKLPPFIAYLLHHRDALTHTDFQMFLQQHRLSSHVRVAAKK
jgi:hypothetical protein